MMDQILQGVFALTLKELKDIRAKHGEKYASLHEGWAVLLEEAEETKEELENVTLAMDRLWRITRQDKTQLATDCASQIAHFAARAAAEAIQISAVARKIAEAWEDEAADEWED